MRENYLPLNGYENSRLQSGKDGWFGMALVGKWGRRHTHKKERGVYYQKYFPTASSYIIPIFERRGEIRSPKRKFQNGRKQNKCVEKFVCVIHRKREWGYFIIIILYFFFLLWSREKTWCVGQFPRSTCTRQNSFHSSFSSSFSPPLHIFLFCLFSWLGWLGFLVGVGRTFTIDRLVPRSEIASSHFLQLGVVALFFFSFC